MLDNFTLKKEGIGAQKGWPSRKYAYLSIRMRRGREEEVRKAPKAILAERNPQKEIQ
jgi:hypothetical protein